MPANFTVWNIHTKDFENQDDFGKIKHLLRYAILAPSTHNMQPWLFTIKKSSVIISYDPKLTLPQADARGRDLHISLGCCLENLVIAASYFNVFDKVTYFPKQKNAVAEVYFKNLQKAQPINNQLTPLFQTITKRVNSRGLFKNQSISSSIIKKLRNTNSFPELKVHLMDDKKNIVTMSKLTAQGLRHAYKSALFRKEMSGWVNPNFSSRNEGIPGYSLRLPTFLSLIFPIVVRNFNVGKRVGQINYVSMASSRLVCVITAKKDTKENWLNTGRLAERMMLSLQSEKVKTSIFVASVEMGELYKQVQKIIKSTSIPVFVFCAGYMNHSQKQTPRHPLEAKIISA